MSRKRISIEIQGVSLTSRGAGPLPELEQAGAWTVRQRSHVWRPPTDIYETEDAFVVLVEVAGMREAEFVVTLDRQLLSIRGVRADREGPKAYHQMEVAYGEFVTEVQIPVPVDAPRIDASYADGFLRVRLPKARPKQIAVSG